MQPVDPDKARSQSLGDGRGQRPDKEAAPASWFALAKAHADHAARAGFVVSMMFLGGAALYALNLSGATDTVFREVTGIADRAAHDAGFRIDDLTFTGSKNTPRETLLKALGVPYPHSSLTYDTAEAQDRLMKLGWIEAAEVRRILPSRLDVVVTEREPFARWLDAENVVQAIDREGRILGPAEGRYESLLLFAGEGAPTEAADLADALARHPDVRGRIERLDFVAERFWEAKLDNGLILKLPHKANEIVLAKAETLLSSTKIAEIALETIDLRLTNRTVLQLREPTPANRDRAVAIIASASGQPAPPPRRGRAL